ncbi:TPA: hypothetical protein TZ820_001712 [Streptococcus suis]|uniref:hypothetical protein n=1 Tax=Streptococcus suis TaxID=1307 RepID=UPI00211F2E32|nr:hypothetical protein [Streptococcus suis]HEL2592622.1 hypothetical protein [Streptococcus suis]HEM5079136.1 hypothetical protein [Streptococcus suis]
MFLPIISVTAISSVTVAHFNGWFPVAVTSVSIATPLKTKMSDFAFATVGGVVSTFTRSG